MNMNTNMALSSISETGTTISFELCGPVHISKPNTRSQATFRREVRRRSNLPRAMQKRLGFKCI